MRDGRFTDKALIEEIHAGSRTAFEKLMRRHQRLVYRVSFAYTRDRDDALEVTQDVFVKVHRKLGSYRGTGTLRSWLLRIAHRESLNWLRDHGKHRGAVELTAATVPHSAPVQESDLLARERQRELLAELTELNPKQRLAVTLRYWGDVPIREIATVLGCSDGVVKNILFRSLQKLRRRLAARWSEDDERLPLRTADPEAR